MVIPSFTDTEHCSRMKKMEEKGDSVLRRRREEIEMAKECQSLDIHGNFNDFDADYEKKMERRCIYRCPHGLTTIKDLEHIHIPQLVSIGPYHFGREHLQAMQLQKRRALYKMLMRTHDLHSSIELQQWLELRKESFMNSFRQIEKELKDCYDQLRPEWSSSEAFLEMMLLDSCFMLELLRSTEPSDPIFGSKGSPYIRAMLRRDALILENQIPVLALKCLLTNLGNMGESVADPNVFLNQLFIDFFDLKPLKPELGSRPGLHALDIYRECLIQSPPSVYSQNIAPSRRRMRDVIRKYIPPSSFLRRLTPAQSSSLSILPSPSVNPATINSLFPFQKFGSPFIKGQ